MKTKLCIAIAAVTAVTMVYAEDDKPLLDAGLIEVGAGWVITENENIGSGNLDDEKYAEYIGSGRFSIPLAEQFSLQLDIDGVNNGTSRENGDDQFQSSFSGSGHLAFRDPSQFAAGIFAQRGNASGGENEDAQLCMGGVEGQLYVDNLTLYGQFGMFNTNDEDENDSITDAWVARGVARYFPTSDSKIEIEAAYTAGEDPSSGNSGGDIDALSWGLRYDYKLSPDRPYSVFASYNGLKIEADNPGSNKELLENRFTIGFSVLFGANTHLENDRQGATFDTPDVGRLAGWTLEAIDF